MTIKLIVEIIILLLIFVPAIYRNISVISDISEITGTVTDKYIKDDKYLIYTKDQNGESRVFQITDNIFKKRFDSSDVYNLIEVGKTYKFTVGGQRFKPLSWYPNIYEFEEIQ